MENNDVKPKRGMKKIVILLAVLILICAAAAGVCIWNASRKEEDKMGNDNPPINGSDNSSGDITLDENGRPDDGADITETKTAVDKAALRELLLADGKFAIELTEDVRTDETFLVNGTKKLIGNKSIVMELYAEPLQSLLTVQAGATLILDGVTLDGNGLASGVKVGEHAGFTGVSGKILYPAPYGVITAGTAWVKGIAIERGIDTGLCVEKGGKAYMEGGEIFHCVNSGIYIATGGYVSISDDARVRECRMNVNNSGTCMITGGDLSDAWRCFVWNLGDLTVNYQGKNVDDRLEWSNAGEFGIRSGNGSTTNVSSLYVHDVAKVAIRGVNHKGMTVTNCVCANTGTYGFESANGQEDVTITDLQTIHTENAGVRVYGLNTIDITNLTVTDAGGRGIQNGNSTVIARNVTIENTKLAGIYGGDGSVTEVDGATIKGAATYGIENYHGTITAKNIMIQSPELSGVYARKDTVTNLSNVTIRSPKERGIFNLGGTVTADTVTVDSPGRYGVTSTGADEYAGSLTATNLTVTGVKENNALNCNASVMVVNGGTLSDIKGHGAQVGLAGQLTLNHVTIKDCGMRGVYVAGEGSKATVVDTDISDTGMSGAFVGTKTATIDLKNVTIAKAGLAAGTETEYTASYRSGLGATAGEIKASHVTVADAVGSGVYVNGGTIEAEEVSVLDARQNGVYVTRSATYGEAVVKINGLTVTKPGNRGVFNVGGDVTMTDVKITDPEEYGVTTAVAEEDSKKYPGAINITNLTVSGVKKNNALNCTESVMVVNGGTLSDIKAYGARVRAGGQLDMTGVKINACGQRGIFVEDDGSKAKVTDTDISDTGMSGIFVGSGKAAADLKNVTITRAGLTSGTDTGYTASYRSGLGTTAAAIKASHVTITDAVGSGVYVNGGTIEAEELSVLDAGQNGVYVARSATYGEAVAKINGLTVTSPANRGVFNDGGNVTLADVTITDPAEYGMTTAASDGYPGILYAENVTVTGVKKNNALNCNGSAMTVNGGTISNTNLYDALVRGGGSLSLTDVAVIRGDGNTAGSMSVKEDAALTIAGASSITGSGAAKASAIYVEKGSLHIDGGTYSRNIASNNGGVIYVADNGTATIRNAVFRDNGAVSDKASTNGGVLYVANGGAADIAGCTFTGNTAKYTGSEAKYSYGGAICSVSTKEDAVRINNATFEKNSSDYGGAISVGGNCNLTLTDVSFLDNEGSYGKDIRTAASKINLSGKIVAEAYSTSSPNVLNVAGVLTEGSNLVVRYGNISKVNTGAVIVTFAEGTMSASKRFVKLAEEHTGEYELEYVDGTGTDDGTAILKKKGTEPEQKAVARIGDVRYGTFSEAVVAAAAASDAEHPVSIVIISEDAVMLDGPIMIPEDANIVITNDGEARTLKRSTEYAGVLFQVGNHATLTFVGSKKDDVNSEENKTSDFLPLLTIDGNKAEAAYEEGTAAVVNMGKENGTLVIGKGVQLINNKSFSSGGVIRTEDNENGGAAIIVNGARFADNEVITGKTALYGGVLYIAKGSTAAITDTVFEGNGILGTTAAVSGGVLHVANGGKVTVEACTFRENKAAYTGTGTGNNSFGGVLSTGVQTKDDVIVKDSVFTGNVADGNKGKAFGGAVSVGGNCHLTMSGCVFDKNEVKGAKGSGGKDVRTAGGTQIWLSGKTIAEFFNTTAAYNLNVTGNLAEESRITMKWNDPGKVADKTVITFTDDSIMNVSKEYISLDSSHNGAYQLIFSDQKGVLKKVGGGIANACINIYRNIWHGTSESKNVFSLRGRYPGRGSGRI